MKARPYPVVLSLLVCWLAQTPVPAADAFSFVDPTDPTVAEVRKTGEFTIDQAGNALVMEVRRLLASSSPASVVGQMHLRSYKLPAAAPNKPGVTTLRLTSLKVRNPANAPDAADRAALEHIKQQLSEGDPVSQLLIQKVELSGQAPEWRVYRPLVTLKQCLACHGPVHSLDADLAAALKLRYPADEAVDYKASEWRGMLRVSLAPAPERK